MTSSPTILLLDDEPLLRRATALMLSRRGGQVTAVATADEAVACARERVYDVAVVDLSPPGPGPADAARRIRAEGLVPGRVIAVSNEPAESLAAAGIDLVLPRPYPFEALLDAVFGARPASRGEEPREASTTPPPPRAARRRTWSGVFPVVSALGRPSSRIKGPGPRAAARAGRGPGG